MSEAQSVFDRCRELEQHLAAIQAERDGLRDEVKGLRYALGCIHQSVVGLHEFTLKSLGNPDKMVIVENLAINLREYLDRVRGAPTPPAGLRWSSERPSKEGWWWRKADYLEPRVTQIEKAPNGKLRDGGWYVDDPEYSGEWAGPLQAPEG